MYKLQGGVVKNVIIDQIPLLVIFIVRNVDETCILVLLHAFDENVKHTCEVLNVFQNNLVDFLMRDLVKSLL